MQRRTWLAGAMGWLLLVGAQAGEAWNVEFSAPERRLVITAPAREAASELRIYSDGLSKPEVGADVGEPGEIYLPPPPGAGDGSALLAEAQNIYFFSEFVPATGWELVIRFGAGAHGTWKLNGRFSSAGGAQRDEVTVPLAELEAGENLLHLRGENIRVPELYLRRRAAPREHVSETLRTIPANWAGRVTRWERAGAEPLLLSEHVVAATPLARQAREWPEQWWNERARLREAALAVGRNLLSNQVRQRGSMFEGGFNLVYDPTQKAHRMAHWIWAWGPSIDLLLQLARLEPDAARAAEMRTAALAAAQRSLAFEVTTASHPARGISTVRWEPSRATPQGWAEYASTADSLFMAGWGWMSAYAETKEPRYLERMRSLVAAAERLMGEYPVIPQDWIFERQRWTPHTLDESLFGTIGFRRLHAATGEARVAAAGREFLESHLRHMGRESGLLARAWLRDENKDIWDPDIKGHAWVIEGYLDGYRLSGDEKYLALARELAAKVISCQSPDGSWTYLFKRAEPTDPVDDKGTAIWAYLFYDLHRLTHDPAHLAAGRRALGWCLRQQYRGEDPNLDGAIYHPCSMAYVRRRAMTVLYTTTFFGHALLEELALDKTR